MMEMRQRHQLAHELEQLRQKLLPYENKTVKELPAEMQKVIRSYDVLEPITSSGLEHVTAILGRLIWSVYYLKDPNFPANYQAPPPKSRFAQESTQAAPAADPVPADRGSDLAEEPGELDFGPFDPRKSSA